MAYEYSQGLDNIARERYKTKLAAAGLASCPYKLEAGRWKNDPTEWPDVQYPDIYSYLIDTPGVYTKESMKNYRSLEAHNYFISGWVNTVHHYLTDSKLFLMKANVKPSMRLNDEPHHPWVVIKNDGVVTAAHCDCMAGLGESCSHVAALLFKIEAAVRMGYTKTACTDQPCEWNQCFTNKVEPAPIFNINFYKDASKEKLCDREPRGKPPMKATPQQQEDFLTKLASASPHCVGLSSFKEFSDNFPTTKTATSTCTSNDKLPMNFRDLYDAKNISNLNLALQNAQQEVSEITSDERKYLCEASSEQSGSTTWYEMRLGRVTASRMHSVLHTSQEHPAPSVLKSICMPSASLSHLPAIKWGREHEADAITEYETKHRESHEGSDYAVNVEQTGLWLHKEHPFIGASPDALVHCSICGFGVLEVKCPYKYRDYMSEEQVLLDNGCMDSEFELKRSHTYYSQVQTQIMVCEAKYADFVLWTPKFTKVDRIQPDTYFSSNVLHVVPKFWLEHCLPELLTRKLEHGDVEKDTASGTTEDNEFQFCYCKTDTGGIMIGCDNPGCLTKWFHLACLKRKRAPKGDWYCNDCKRQVLFDIE